MIRLIEHFTLTSPAVTFAHPAQVSSRVQTILQTDRRRSGVSARSAIPFVLAALCIAPLGTLHVMAQQAQTSHTATVRKPISHASSAARAKHTPQAVTLAASHSVNAQRTIQFTRKTSSAVIHAVIANHPDSASNKVTTHVGQSENFPDVPKNHWAYQAVLELKQKGILIGYPPAR
jgi:hypothetical protein